MRGASRADDAYHVLSNATTLAVRDETRSNVERGIS